MSRAYRRADALSLEQLLQNRANARKKTAPDKVQEIIARSNYGTPANPYQYKKVKNSTCGWEVIEEKDLRKDIPGQLEIKENE